VADERLAPAIVCVGEPLVALVGAGDEALDIVPSFTAHVVGAELNVAVGIARLGLPVAFVGRCGKDALGERVVRSLRSEAVDVTHLRRDDRPTGLLLRSVRPYGISEVVYARADSAGSRLGPLDIDDARDAIAASEWLHVSGITAAISDSGGEAVRAAFRCARANGTRISFDVNLRERIRPVDHQRALLSELAADADLVLCGEDEGERLTGEADPRRLAALFRQAGARMVVVKQGAAGAIAVDSTGRYASCAARPLEQVVDHVGAGDAFAAGLLAEMISGRTLADALDGAVICAAYAMAARGDTEGLPRPHELEAARRGQSTSVVR
jgi:2-dehydro-3-deoxygluconokinase